MFLLVTVLSLAPGIAMMVTCLPFMLIVLSILRQGVGLQSYAQKDPLAEYRVRAYEMFQELLADIRSLVISRVFAVRRFLSRRSPYASASA